MTQFQAANAERNDTLELVKSINSAHGETALPAKSLEAAFDLWWLKLDEKLREIEREAVSSRKEIRRTEMDLLAQLPQLQAIRKKFLPISRLQFEQVSVISLAALQKHEQEA